MLWLLTSGTEQEDVARVIPELNVKARAQLYPALEVGTAVGAVPDATVQIGEFLLDSASLMRRRVVPECLDCAFYGHSLHVRAHVAELDLNAEIFHPICGGAKGFGGWSSSRSSRTSNTSAKGSKGSRSRMSRMGRMSRRCKRSRRSRRCSRSRRSRRGRRSRRSKCRRRCSDGVVAWRKNKAN